MRAMNIETAWIHFLRDVFRVSSAMDAQKNRKIRNSGRENWENRKLCIKKKIGEK